jgi:cytochrome c-type biogenesis protein
MAPISLPLAFLAGLLSFASPCVLPLVPVYLGYLSGSSIMAASKQPEKVHVLSHALLFIAGFTLIFVLIFGAPAGFIGSFHNIGLALARIGGLFLIVFALHLSGGFNGLAFLFRNMPRIGKGLRRLADGLDTLILPERRLAFRGDQTPGYRRSLIMGMVFAAGWTPCIGPLLGAIIAIAVSGRDFLLAISLLFMYSLGLALPFIAAALLMEKAKPLWRSISRYARAIELLSSIFLLAVGVLLLTDNLSRLNDYVTASPAYLQNLERSLLNR